MAFQNYIKFHLTNYKTRTFPGVPNGYWKRKGKAPVMLGYAFTEADREKNLINPYKSDYLNSRFTLRDKIKLHLYFHHLNSSQAMCINFFFPLFKENRLDLVLDFLGFTGDRVRYDTVAFEKESKIDGVLNYRPTNFDFFFETELGKKFYFEIKYTEHDFGKAPKDKTKKTLFDQEHIDKFIKVYSKNLGAIKPAYQGINGFLSNYQLLRNVIHAGPSSYVVFVYPRENTRIKLGVRKALNEMVVDNLAQHVMAVEWRRIFDYVRKYVYPSTLWTQLNLFEDKYFLEYPPYCEYDNPESEKLFTNNKG